MLERLQTQDQSETQGSVPRLLIIDTNSRGILSNTSRTELSRLGPGVFRSQALSAICEEPTDIILLIEQNGISIEEVRKLSQKPVIVVSRYDNPKEKVATLDNGADQFVVIPETNEETIGVLIAFIKSLNRRVSGELSPNPNPKTVRIGDLVINLDTRVITKYGEIYSGFSRTENRLLFTFANQPGTPIPHDEVLKTIWGEKYKFHNALLHTNICRMRKKLRRDFGDFYGSIFENIFTVGYKLNISGIPVVSEKV